MNNYSQMVSDLAKRGEAIIATLTPIKAHTLHMAIGLAGEAGELLEHYCSIEPVLHSEILEEFGDAEFYFEGLCQSMAITIDLSGATSGDPMCVPRYTVEAATMLDIVKNMVVYNKDIDLMTFVNGLTKVRTCLDRAYDYYGLTQAEALDHNINKLLKGDTARYKEGTYSDEAAQSRRDKQEVIYAIGEYNGKGGYAMWAGPTPNLNMLKLEEGKSENSCILSFDNRGEETIVARWNELLGCWQDHEPQQ
jgi:hypothetical protein